MAGMNPYKELRNGVNPAWDVSKAHVVSSRSPPLPPNKKKKKKKLYLG